MISGTMTLPSLKGMEVRPGVFLLGEPFPIPGTDKLQALANVGGVLCLIQLRITFPKGAAA